MEVDFSIFDTYDATLCADIVTPHWEIAHLNRYADILPRKSTLVKLPGTGNYINANYVNGSHSPHENGSYHYIATQAPLEESTYEFWSMIWENNVEIIVMLVNLDEGRNKVSKYWSDTSVHKNEDIEITVRDIQETYYGFKRIICIKKNMEERTITHYNYNIWEDMKTTCPKTLFKFIKDIQDVNNKKSPMVVHCSAGIGRTGCLMLIDSMLWQYKEDKNNVPSIHETLLHLRKHRASLVANKSQYRFCKKVIQLYNKNEE